MGTASGREALQIKTTAGAIHVWFSAGLQAIKAQERVRTSRQRKKSLSLATVCTWLSVVRWGGAALAGILSLDACPVDTHPMHTGMHQVASPLFSGSLLD